MGEEWLREPIPEMKRPFSTRKEVEEAMKEILDLMEQGNWIRAENKTHVLTQKLNQMIDRIEKGELKL